VIAGQIVKPLVVGFAHEENGGDVLHISPEIHYLSYWLSQPSNLFISQFEKLTSGPNSPVR
jgi:hypothetical protein